MVAMKNDAVAIRARRSLRPWNITAISMVTTETTYNNVSEKLAVFGFAMNFTL